ncbi:MAG: PLP-dependent transferase [Bdellovibrionales bacterium]|nr:PLP-dependent transferase [Bdellovibrionales bacterium]
MGSRQQMDFATLSVHAGRRVDSTTGSILPPIHQTATYVLEAVGTTRGYDYSRSSNPTRAALEENLAALEGGNHAICFSSGMAAVDAITRLLRHGEHIVSVDDVYGGVSRLFNRVLSRSGITVRYVDGTSASAVSAAITAQTRLIWIETPTNPLLQLVDIAEVARLARNRGILVAVDSTFATPYLLRPLELGADIVVHSTTKYLSGHNQVIGGACITNGQAVCDELRFIQKSVGAVPGPFDCWLTLLGIKTLPLRMEQHQRNARLVAEYLEEHPKVARVLYPGLPSHPQHALARLQQRGFGGMISFELAGGYDAAVELMNSVRLCSLAESLGAVETMITHPASMTHADVPRHERELRGVTNGLVRLSVGIEAATDILADLEQALARVSASPEERRA